MNKDLHKVIKRNTANDLIQTLQKNDGFIADKFQFNRWDIRKRILDIEIEPRLLLRQVTDQKLSFICNLTLGFS